MARAVRRGLALCASLAAGGLALAVDGQARIQASSRRELAVPGKRSALLTVCFVSKASPGRHTVDQLTNGCILNVASFKLAAPESDVILIAPAEENAADKIKTMSEKDSSIKISYVGTGPWEVGGQSIPFKNAEGKFYGNGLKLLWYTQTLKKFQGHYDYIFIADGADLYFQRNPFELAVEYPSADLVFFGDRGDSPSRGKQFFDRMMPRCESSKRNEPSLMDAVDKAFMRKVDGRPYSVYANSGLILGKADAMLSLTSQVAEIAAECRFWISDQSFVNLVRYYMMKERGEDKVLMFPDMEKTASLGHYSWYFWTEDGWLANKDTKEKLYVVHQYDRAPQAKMLTELVWNKTAEWIRKHE
ncbi:unnamed protein product [Prorocentrum cordatum]|uniref:Nucleotide-diphospho-sugar transferase domain-containing protein n=1 Tax=Prorocentrum cordatum TaxID=2364126 RepID=A0ABN9TRL8_9DINO|nr:unnamed protein product [Polarella glacialis]